MSEVSSDFRFLIDLFIGIRIRSEFTILKLGWIPRKLFSKLSILSQNCHFWEKITKMIFRINFRIFTNSPYIWFFWILHVKSHHRNDHFQENRENHTWGELVEIRKFILLVIFISKIAIKSSRWKIWNFSEFDLSLNFHFWTNDKKTDKNLTKSGLFKQTRQLFWRVSIFTSYFWFLYD